MGAFGPICGETRQLFKPKTGSDACRPDIPVHLDPYILPSGVKLPLHLTLAPPYGLLLAMAENRTAVLGLPPC